MLDQTIIEKEFPQLFGSEQLDIFSWKEEKLIKEIKKEIRVKILSKVNRDFWIPF